MVAHPPTARVFRDHRRDYGSFTYVYPVVSRRAGGLSVGINLNPDNACNFDCLYCCVDRGHTVQRGCPVDLEHLDHELRTLLTLVRTDEIWGEARFADTPADHRHLADIAFSGNGEPTACPSFPEAVDLTLRARDELAGQLAGMVLITNATLLDRPGVAEAVGRLAAGGGEIWAKLDAGSPAYYQLVNRSRVPLERVLGNILTAGRRHPLVLQTMLMNLMGRPMPEYEFEAYLDRVDDLLGQGCQIRAVHLYTIARDTAEPWVAPLDAEAMQGFAEQFAERVPGVAVQTFI